LEKISKIQTKDRIASILREEIFSGRIADGKDLPQEQLADLFAVSRMPVREALQILEMEGLLYRLPNRHIKVIGFREDIVRQNLCVLAAAEAEVAWILASANVDVSCLDPSNDLLFHTSISTMTGNRYLEQFHHRMLNGYPRYVWEKVTGWRDSTALNMSIRTSVLASDEEAVGHSVRRYYKAMAEVLIETVGRKIPND